MGAKLTNSFCENMEVKRIPFNGFIGKVPKKMEEKLGIEKVFTKEQVRMVIALNALPFFGSRMDYFPLAKDEEAPHYKQKNKIHRLIDTLIKKYANDIPDAESFIWAYLRRVFHFTYKKIPKSRVKYMIDFLTYLIEEPKKILLPIALPTETIFAKNNTFDIYCLEYHYVFPVRTLFAFDVNLASFFKFKKAVEIIPLKIQNIEKDTQFLANPTSFVKYFAKELNTSFNEAYKALGVPLSYKTDNDELFINKINLSKNAYRIYCSPILDPMRRVYLQEKTLYTDTRRLNLYYIWKQYQKTRKNEFQTVMEKWLQITTNYLSNSVHKNYFLFDSGEYPQSYIYYMELKKAVGRLLHTYYTNETPNSKKYQKIGYNFHVEINKIIENEIGFARKYWLPETYEIAVNKLDKIQISDLNI